MKKLTKIVPLKIVSGINLLLIQKDTVECNGTNLRFNNLLFPCKIKKS